MTDPTAFRPEDVLQDQVLGTLLDKLDLKQKPADDSSKRRHERHSCRYRRIIQILTNVDDASVPLKALSVFTRDISTGGLGFIHDQPMTIDTLCVIQLNKGDERKRVRGRVAHCEAINDTIYHLGLSFLEPLEPQFFRG